MKTKWFDRLTTNGTKYYFAVETEQEAQQLVATDPVIKNGEMIAEYHLLYASAALMAVNEIHEKIAPQ